MKGQLSAEMLILIVVIIAVVGIAALQLMNTVKSASKQIDEESNQIFDMAKNTDKNKAGEFCVVNGDCISDDCNEPINECN
jgi:uncharacterized protein (UPF0333 family)